MVKAENKGKSTPKKNSAKIVATNFEVGQKVICLTHPGNIKYGTYGWEEQPIIDEIIGLPKNEKDDLFYTKESPRGIHESRVHPFDPNRIIKIQESFFISKWPVIMRPHKGLYNFQWQNNQDNSRQDFAFPIAADLDYITWELLGLGFQIIHTKLMTKPHKKEFLELVEPVEVVEATNPPKKNVATKKIASHHIICDFCGKQNYPDHNNPHLFWGFRDADTGMFIGNDCKQLFYNAKDQGKYGRKNIGLRSEVPEPVPQNPLNHNSKLSKDGLEKLLPAKGKKKGIKELLNNNNVATNDKPNNQDNDNRPTLIFGIWYAHSRPHELWQLPHRLELKWLDDCPDNILEEIHHYEPAPTIGERPINWFELHIWLLERGFIVKEIEPDFEEFLDEIEFDECGASSLPYYLVTGRFGYNKADVCVYGAENVTEISIDKGKVYASAEVAKGSKGWVFGYRTGSMFTHVGAGGLSSGIWYNAQDQYEVKYDASIAVLHHVLREFESCLRKAPPSAAKTYKKAIDVLKAQIGGEPEPQPINSIDSDKDVVVATKKTMPIRPPKSPSDPRTEMMKFRLSNHTRNVLTTLATELNLSCADIIHLGIKSMARTAKTKYTEEELNQIIEL